MKILKVGFLLLAAISALPAAASSSPIDESARSIAQETLDRMFVRQIPAHVHTMNYEVQSVTFDLLENDHFGPPFPVQGITSGKEIDDLRNHRQLTIIKDDGALKLLTANAETAGKMADGRATFTKALPPPPAWQVLDPLQALTAALASDNLDHPQDEVRNGVRYTILSFISGRSTIKIFIDQMTALPMLTESRFALDDGATGSVAWNGRGDIVQRAEFMNWDLVAGVRTPTQIDIYRNDDHFQAIVRRPIGVNDSKSEALLASLPPALPPDATPMALVEIGQVIGPDPKHGTEEIAPGIVQFAGSWYSTVVRQDDGLVILDAPIAPAYSRKIIAEAERRFPGQPIKAVVTSTAFSWHVGGLREYAGRGIPIYVRDRNLPIIEAMLRNPYTLAVDASNLPRKAPILRAVSERTRIGRGRNAVFLMPVRYGEQPMLMSWIPDAAILHTGEMVQPLGPNGSLLFPESLFEISMSVAEEKIPTNKLKIIGMHMSPTPWSKVSATLKELLPAK